VPEPQRRHLAHEAHLPWRRQIGARFGEDRGLALRFEHGLQLGVVVEVIFDRGLAAAGHEDDVLDAGRARLGHGIGQHRPIEHVEQVLGDGLAGRHHPRTETRHGQHGLAHWLHELTPLSQARRRIQHGDADGGD
jgi:hypothetical protein